MPPVPTFSFERDRNIIKDGLLEGWCLAQGSLEMLAGFLYTAVEDTQEHKVLVFFFFFLHKLYTVCIFFES